jgi:L-lactate dehydrogenase complex protein LldG
MVSREPKEKMSREKILDRIRSHQPEKPTVIGDFSAPMPGIDHVQKFVDTLTGIGGAVIRIQSLASLNDYFQKHFEGQRIISLVEGTYHYVPNIEGDAHLLENVALTVLRGEFAVAENGAVWITDKQMGDRALPFIASHLAMVVFVKDILPTLHDAYARIGDTNYAFGTFIAGPSKTADIEQSLVLGAHGPKSNTIFLIEE